MNAPSISQEPFRALPDGRPVQLWVLDNGRGTTVSFLNLGGAITEILVPDRSGVAANIALGFQDTAGYAGRAGETGRPYFGALIGRYANRIARARFTLDGVEHRLTANDGRNTLHGGPGGFDAQLWSVTPHAPDARQAGVTLRHVSPAGAQGFPGTLSVEVDYVLTAESELVLTYRATTDAPTVLNLTNHTYFNLAGEGAKTVGGHLIEVAADRFVPVGEGGIPLGALAQVEGTPLDLRTATLIGQAMRRPHEQVVRVHGLDHSWVLRDPDPATGLRLAATVYDPASGRHLVCLTTQPGLQLYTGNALDGTITGSSGALYRQGAGFALETQHFPDSPNQPGFPSTVLRPGQTFHERTVYRFGTKPAP